MSHEATPRIFDHHQLKVKFDMSSSASKLKMRARARLLRGRPGADRGEGSAQVDVGGKVDPPSGEPKSM